MIARVLRKGMRGDDVAEWQLFLMGQTFDPGLVDGAFGENTHMATRGFQEAHSLGADGIVGRMTLTCALGLGLGTLADPDNTAEVGPNWPPLPDFSPARQGDREAMFTRFSFVSAPQPSNREAIRITDSWEKDNIVLIEVPQLRGKKGADASGHVRCHRLAADQIRAVFTAWERAKLIDRVLTWEGCYVPRYIRGSQTVLSNHAFGSAFDINAQWNGYGAEPARVGQKGSVRELVEIANDLGFFWGGHFSGRLDGMHFEVAKLMDLDDAGGGGERGLVASLALAAGVSAPPVPADLSGSAFYQQIQSLVGPARENAIFDAVAGGATPPSLRGFCDVELAAVDRNGKTHTGTVRVLSDYLAVGSDYDFLRVPMNPMTAQRIADAYGCVLPTKRLVDVIHEQAELKLTPLALPASAQMVSSPYYKRHNDRVEAQRSGRATGRLTAGHKKDVVITNRLTWKKERVAIYGWHYPSGQAIQPLSTVHEDTYADYSHGIRLVDGTMIADGQEMKVADVLKHESLSSLLSDEGAIGVTAYTIR